MQVTTNMTLVKRRSRLGTYASLAGLVVLVIGMIASIRGPSLIWVSMGAIVIGFALAQLGAYNLRRWGRSPRPDQVLETAMKGFDDRYHFYAWTLPVPYVLLSPQGVHVFVTRDQTGQISVNGSQWKSKMTVGRALALFAQEGLGNPTLEAQQMASRLETWIRSALPDAAVSVQPSVVFIDERVNLQVNEPTVPVNLGKSLKKWLRSSKGDTLKAAEYRALEELFNNAA